MDDKFDNPAKLGEVVFMIGQTVQGVVAVFADIIGVIGEADPALSAKIIEQFRASLLRLETVGATPYVRVVYDGVFHEMKMRGGDSERRVAQ